MTRFTVRKAADYCWAVIGPDGKVVEVCRTRKSARNLAQDLNRSA